MTITFTWGTLFSILASLVTIAGGAGYILKIYLKKIWDKDIEDGIKAINLDKKFKDFEEDLDIDNKIQQSLTQAMTKVEMKIELVHRDLGNVTDVIRDLKGVIERYQEQQMESQIESARTSEKLESLSTRLTTMEQK